VTRTILNFPVRICKNGKRGRRDGIYLESETSMGNQVHHKLHDIYKLQAKIQCNLAQRNNFSKDPSASICVSGFSASLGSLELEAGSMSMPKSTKQ